MNFSVIQAFLRRAGVIRSVFVLVMITGAPANGNLTITPTFDTTITSDPNSAAIIGTLNQVVTTYENLFADPINVSIKFEEITTGLGQSSTTLYKLSYQTFSNALIADATSADDAAALANLPAATTNPVTGSTTIDVKSANIRALGIAGAFTPLSGFDGVIGLNTQITDAGSPGTSGAYDLAVIAAHEIDEVLGLGSDLPFTTGFFADPSAEDLFRYDSAGNRSHTTDPNAAAYFSIDGVTKLAQFNNQNNGGDYGDWQKASGDPAQVQDAFATQFAHPALGLELRALDVIGYDLASTSAPEPGTAMLSASMLLGLGWSVYRRCK